MMSVHTLKKTQQTLRPRRFVTQNTSVAAPSASLVMTALCTRRPEPLRNHDTTRSRPCLWLVCSFVCVLEEQVGGSEGALNKKPVSLCETGAQQHNAQHRQTTHLPE